MRQALRSDPELVATKVVAVEAGLTEELVRQRLAEGFDACIAKPYTLGSAVRTIEEATNLVA
jgi:CheY-like chemotaxis protein